MKTPLIVILFLLTMLFSCGNSSNKSQERNTVSNVDTLQQDTSKSKNQLEETLRTIPKNTQPIFGYRFVITGDFDGDGKIEKLIEHYFLCIG